MAPISGILVALREVDHPSGPTAPVASIIPPCSGWSCLSDAEQFGIIFSIVVVALLCLVAGWIALRPNNEDELGLELVRIPSASYGMTYAISSPPQLVAPVSPMITMAAPPVQVYPQPSSLTLPPHLVQTGQPVPQMQPGPVYYQLGNQGMGARSFSASHCLSAPEADSNTDLPQHHFQGEVNAEILPPNHIPTSQGDHKQPKYHSEDMVHQGQTHVKPRQPSLMPNPAYGYPMHQQLQLRNGLSWKQRLHRLFATRTGRASTISGTSSNASGMASSPGSTPAHSRAPSPGGRDSAKAAAGDGSTPPTTKKFDTISTRPATPFPKNLSRSSSLRYAQESSTPVILRIYPGSYGDSATESSLCIVRNNKRSVSRQSERSWRSQARSIMEHESHSRASSSSSDTAPQTPQPKGADWK